MDSRIISPDRRVARPSCCPAWRRRRPVAGCTTAGTACAARLAAARATNQTPTSGQTPKTGTYPHLYESQHVSTLQSIDRVNRVVYIGEGQTRVTRPTLVSEVETVTCRGAWQPNSNTNTNENSANACGSITRLLENGVMLQ